MQDIQVLLTQAGLNLTGWMLNSAKSVSPDGNFIVGNGTDPNGAGGQGWVAALSGGAGVCSPLPAPTALAAAILPASRSAMVGSTATEFATIINGGPTEACAVGIALATGIPATFTYNTTDCKTNAVTGATNAPVNIPIGAQASYVIAITPTAPFGPVDVAFNFGGGNTVPVAPIVGVNTLLMSGSNTPVPSSPSQRRRPTTVSSTSWGLWAPGHSWWPPSISDWAI